MSTFLRRLAAIVTAVGLLAVTQVPVQAEMVTLTDNHKPGNLGFGVEVPDNLDHVCAGRKLLYQAHVDALYGTYINGKLSTAVVDGQVVRPIDEVCLRLAPDADNEGVEVSRLVIPDDPSFSDLGAPGTIVWYAPRTVDFMNDWRPVWAGMGAFDPNHEITVPENFVDNKVTFDLVNFDGPGDMSVFYETPSMEKPEYSLRTGKNPVTSFDYEVGGHGHYDWTFTKAGIYRLTVQIKARTTDGKDLLGEPKDLVWLVGSDSEVGLPEGTTENLNPITTPAETLREEMGLPAPPTETSESESDTGKTESSAPQPQPSAPQPQEKTSKADSSGTSGSPSESTEPLQPSEVPQPAIPAESDTAEQTAAPVEPAAPAQPAAPVESVAEQPVTPAHPAEHPSAPAHAVPPEKPSAVDGGTAPVDPGASSNETVPQPLTPPNPTDDQHGGILDSKVHHLVTEGHMDLMALANASDGFQVMLKDGANPARELLYPSGTFAFEVNNSTKTAIPAQARRGVPNAPDTVYELPSVQVDGIPWLGFSTLMQEGAGIDTSAPVNVGLAHFEGPGRMIVTEATLTKYIVRMDSTDLSKERSYGPRDHNHPAFWFTEPGVYTVSFRYTAQKIDGNKESRNLDVTFLVGDETINAGRQEIEKRTTPQGTGATLPEAHSENVAPDHNASAADTRQGSDSPAPAPQQQVSISGQPADAPAVAPGVSAVAPEAAALTGAGEIPALTGAPDHQTDNVTYPVEGSAQKAVPAEESGIPAGQASGGTSQGTAHTALGVAAQAASLREKTLAKSKPDSVTSTGSQGVTSSGTKTSRASTNKVARASQGTVTSKRSGLSPASGSSKSIGSSAKPGRSTSASQPKNSQKPKAASSSKATTPKSTSRSTERSTQSSTPETTTRSHTSRSSGKIANAKGSSSSGHTDNIALSSGISPLTKTLFGIGLVGALVGLGLFVLAVKTRQDTEKMS